MADRLTGRIDFFTTSRGKRGFGYLTAMTQERFFFRMEGPVFPAVGALVCFDIEPQEKSGQYRRAINITLAEVTCPP